MTRFFPGARELAQGSPLPAPLEEALVEPKGEMRLADGRWLRLSRSASNDGGFVVIASDITELKERETALQQAKDEAEAASRAKTQFLANMSHELRTPLNAVIGFSEIIAGEMIGPIGVPKYKEYASDIVASGRHLLDVINDILDSVKLQSGKLTLRLEPVPIAEVVETAIRMMREQAESAGIKLNSSVERVIMHIDADLIRLRQVMLNLLSNAIKFTSRGGLVAVTAQRVAAGIRVAVSDTGIGIAPDDIPKALEPFNQVDNSLSRKYGGTGLGLYLSKLYVEGHGGALTIESAPGVGTTVAFTVPASAAPEVLAAAAHAAPLALAG